MPARLPGRQQRGTKASALVGAELSGHLVIVTTPMGINHADAAALFAEIGAMANSMAVTFAVRDISDSSAQATA